MDLQLIEPKHQVMFKKVLDEYPMISKATEVFNKSQSQFMDNTFTISQLTPLRSARQCLAEIKKVKLAIEEAFYSIRKKEIAIKKAESLKKTTKDELDIELLDIEIAENQTQISNISDNVNGSIRKMSNFIAQYKSILKKYGKESFTEEDFEKDEERYHIMKVFEQGLTAARARGGIIDEGNLIYLFQLGISGTAAQIEIRDFFEAENNRLVNGHKLEHADNLKWLESLADKYSGSAKVFAEHKGINLIDEDSLLTT